jgi:hypothetical protein
MEFLPPFGRLIKFSEQEALVHFELDVEEK